MYAADQVRPPPVLYYLDLMQGTSTSKRSMRAPAVPNATVNLGRKTQWKGSSLALKYHPPTVRSLFHSTTTQNTVSNVPNVMTSLRRRRLGTKCVRSLLVSQLGTDPVSQHYDEAHRSIECPGCDREFETQKAMDQVHGQPPTNGHLLKVS